MKNLVSDAEWRHFPELIQDRPGTGLEGHQQYFNEHFTHNTVNCYLEQSSFARHDKFDGAEKTIATIPRGPPTPFICTRATKAHCRLVNDSTHLDFTLEIPIPL